LGGGAKTKGETQYSANSPRKRTVPLTGDLQQNLKFVHNHHHFTGVSQNEEENPQGEKIDGELPARRKEAAARPTKGIHFKECSMVI